MFIGYNSNREETKSNNSFGIAYSQSVARKGILPMHKSEIPLAFMCELVKDKRAMQNYASLSEQEKSVILLKVRKAQSQDDMRVIAMSLSDKIGAEEYL